MVQNFSDDAATMGRDVLNAAVTIFDAAMPSGMSRGLYLLSTSKEAEL